MTAIDPVYALPHLAAILISGLEAEKFLQSQLSSNVAALVLAECPEDAELESQTVQLSSWCAANGRAIGLGWLFRTSDGYCWIVAADTAEALIVGLNKYKFRAKVSITLAGADIGVFGSNYKLSQLLSSGNLVLMRAVQLADGRSLGCAALPLRTTEAAQFLTHWQQRDIEMQIPWNGGGERFLPQMLGIERYAGLSLKKGCFPGQEVISRLHYKGLLKRSLRVLHFDQPVVTGNYLCSDSNDEIAVIQAQELITLAVVSNSLPPNFSIQRDGLTLFCRTADVEFVAAS